MFGRKNPPGLASKTTGDSAGAVYNGRPLAKPKSIGTLPTGGPETQTLKLHVGSMPESTFSPDGNWRSLREPGPLMLQVCAAPIAIALLMVFLRAWQHVGIEGAFATKPDDSPIVGVLMLLSLPAIVVVHELLHAFTYPQDGASDDIVIGVWPSRMLFYAHYQGELSRNRFLLVFLMPILVLSVAPLILAAVFPFPPLLNAALAWCSTLNAAFACGDVFGAGLIAVQVPACATLRNRGYRTYWKVETH